VALGRADVAPPWRRRAPQRDLEPVRDRPAAAPGEGRPPADAGGLRRHDLEPLRSRHARRAILELYRSAPQEELVAAGSRLGDIGCPALVVWGGRDPYIPLEFGRAYADRLPGAELAALPDAGHWPWIERPDVIDRGNGFLAGAEIRPLQSRSIPVLRPLASIGRMLPKGWGDLLRQFALFFLVYQGYQMVRGLADGKAALAIANGDRVIDLERSLGAFFEPGLQQALIAHHWLIDGANFMYLNAQFVITTGFLVWLYLFRNENFYFVRNMFLVAMGLALIGYAAFPTAPPRMFPEAGFTDTIASVANVDQDTGAVSLLVNPYAAVPSMHIAFALMIAVPGTLLSRAALGRAFWSVYPLLVFFVIVVTANHYWFDAAAGAAVACLAALSADRVLSRVRRGWAWPSSGREAPGEATA